MDAKMLQKKTILCILQRHDAKGIDTSEKINPFSWIFEFYI
jgi:hypothetical protein